MSNTMDLSFDLTTCLDLDELEEFINEDLADILVENTTDFGIAAFCLQAVHNEFQKVRQTCEEE